LTHTHTHAFMFNGDLPIDIIGFILYNMEDVVRLDYNNVIEHTFFSDHEIIT